MVLSELLHLRKEGKKEIAVLIDPDEFGSKTSTIVSLSKQYNLNLFLVGGSLVSEGNTQACVRSLKKSDAGTVVLFPGNEMQLCPEADALLFMSLISGRNPEFLISKQVAAAPWVKKSGLESIPTGYMLVESGKLTSANYMSNTIPLPNDKPDITAATAMAGELLGLKVLYLDAGSGAQAPVPPKLIAACKKNTNCPIIVGGGLKKAEDILMAWESGADITVVGNGIFEETQILKELGEVKAYYHQKITL